MTADSVVVWLTEDTWPACVDVAAGLPGAERIRLLHVVDEASAEAAHGALGGLLGRHGAWHRDPGEVITEASREASARLLADARRRLGRDARLETRAGRIEREVVAAVADARLLVCARDGERDRLGPHSIGHHLRFVVDHAPCAVLLIWPEDPPDLGSIPPPPPR